MRLLWFSDPPFVASGYGVQTKMFAPRLAALGHQVAVAAKAAYHGQLLRWAGLDLYPAGRDLHSRDVLPAHAAHFRADATLTLCDAWILEPRLYRGMRWVAWVPVDTEPLLDEMLGKLKMAHRVIAMSRFGERVAQGAGLDVRYAPLGVETRLFVPGDKTAARTRLGIPIDRFLVGLVADNKDEHDRKAFLPQLTAFARFSAAHPDALLYLHTNLGLDNRGLDLLEICGSVGLEAGRNLLLPDQYQKYLGIPQREMVDLYNSFDLLLAVSAWEGFGVPLIEAQACGVPVLTAGWSSTAELAMAGWTVAPSETEPRYFGWRGVCRYPRVDAILDALEQAYRDGPEKLRDRARIGALAYDADTVVREHWSPILDELASDVAGAPKTFREAVFA